MLALFRSFAILPSTWMSLSFIVGQTLKARLPCVESVEAAVTQQPYKMLPDVPPCDVRVAPYTDFLWKNPSAWLSHAALVQVSTRISRKLQK